MRENIYGPVEREREKHVNVSREIHCREENYGISLQESTEHTSLNGEMEHIVSWEQSWS